MCPMKAGIGMETKLTRFIRWTREAPQQEYTSLMGKVFDVEVLRASFSTLAGNKAPGIDGMKKYHPLFLCLRHIVKDFSREPDGVTLHVRF